MLCNAFLTRDVIGRCGVSRGIPLKLHRPRARDQNKQRPLQPNPSLPPQPTQTNTFYIAQPLNQHTKANPEQCHANLTSDDTPLPTQTLRIHDKADHDQPVMQQLRKPSSRLRPREGHPSYTRHQGQSKASNLRILLRRHKQLSSPSLAAAWQVDRGRR